MNQNYSNFKTVRSSSTAPKAKKSALPWVLGCFGALILLVFLAVIGYLVLFTGNNASESIITIREPLGDDDFQIGETVNLYAIAKGEREIEQVELWVDDTLISIENSNIPGGVSPFPITATWIPQQAGNHTISARSTDSKGHQSLNQITVNVLENIDSDGDLIPDHLDRCPNQPGTDAGQGCMDRDYDGIPDESDVCLDEAGLPEDGCPAPSENDHDGDGFLDDADECPDEVGSPSARGCLDTDGDGFANSEDPCPDEAGTTEGCPTTGVIDSDGDGIFDDEDACPTTVGLIENGGCPDMGGVLPPPPDPHAEDEEEESSDSLMGDMGFELDPPHFPENEGFMDMGFEISPLIPIEIRAKEFYSEPSYNSFWCYVTIDDNPPQRYDFDTHDNHYWNIEEILGGENSLHIIHTDDETLRIRLTCVGEASSGEMLGGLDTLLTHPPEQWDGQSRVFEKSNNSIRLEYQVCTPSCDDYHLVAPILQPPTGGPSGNGPYILRWRWDGHSADLDGFKVQHYRNGELYGVYDYGPTIRNIGIADYLADCGATDEFEVYGYKGTERTPTSNREAWITDTCMYNAIVNIQTLDIHHPMADEGGLYEMGPIRGDVHARTADHGFGIYFDTAWRNTWVTRLDGLWLGAGQHRFIDILNWVHNEKAACSSSNCHADTYRASETTVGNISIAEGQSIVVSAYIYEDDTPAWNDSEFLINKSIRIPFDQLVLNSAERFVVEGDVANVIVTIELQEAP